MHRAKEMLAKEPIKLEGVLDILKMYLHTENEVAILRR